MNMNKQFIKATIEVTSDQANDATQGLEFLSHARSKILESCSALAYIAESNCEDDKLKLVELLQAAESIRYGVDGLKPLVDAIDRAIEAARVRTESVRS